MRRNQSSYAKGQIVVAAALTMLMTAPGRALAAEGELGSKDRLVLAMTTRSGGSAKAERTIARDKMAYRFRIESAPAGTWSVTVTISGRSGSASLHLTSATPEIVLPRPLGLLLRAADTVTASAIYDTDGGEQHVTLHIDHEPLDRSGSRLAVLPVRADPHSSAGDIAASWRFTAEVNGRVLALAGLAMQRVHSIALVDDVSGQTLWSANVNHRTSLAYCPALPRLGAMVKAGRTYRVDVVFTESVSTSHLTDAVVLMLPQLSAKQ